MFVVSQNRVQEHFSTVNQSTYAHHDGSSALGSPFPVGRDPFLFSLSSLLYALVVYITSISPSSVRSVLVAAFLYSVYVCRIACPASGLFGGFFFICDRAICYRSFCMMSDSLIGEIRH